MSRHVAFEAETSGQWFELQYETDDVADVSSRIMTGEDAVLTVTFKPGKRPMWEPKP